MKEGRDRVHLAAYLEVEHTAGEMAEVFQVEEADVAEIHRMQVLYPSVSNVPTRYMPCVLSSKIKFMHTARPYTRRGQLTPT